MLGSVWPQSATTNNNNWLLKKRRLTVGRHVLSFWPLSPIVAHFSAHWDTRTESLRRSASAQPFRWFLLRGQRSPDGFLASRWSVSRQTHSHHPPPPAARFYVRKRERAGRSWGIQNWKDIKLFGPLLFPYASCIHPSVCWSLVRPNLFLLCASINRLAFLAAPILHDDDSPAFTSFHPSTGWWWTAALVIYDQLCGLCGPKTLLLRPKCNSITRAHVSRFIQTHSWFTCPRGASPVTLAVAAHTTTFVFFFLISSNSGATTSTTVWKLRVVKCCYRHIF